MDSDLLDDLNELNDFEPQLLPSEEEPETEYNDVQQQAMGLLMKSVLKSKNINSHLKIYNSPELKTTLEEIGRCTSQSPRSQITENEYSTITRANTLAFELTHEILLIQKV